jgi:hypothetical protein
MGTNDVKNDALTENDIAACSELLSISVQQKMDVHTSEQKGQNLDANFVAVLVHEMIVPALVAVGAEITKDAMKDLYLNGKARLSNLVGTKFRTHSPQQQPDTEEIRDHLGPLGFSDDEIDQILATLRGRLQQGWAQRSEVHR